MHRNINMLIAILILTCFNNAMAQNNHNKLTPDHPPGYENGALNEYNDIGIAFEEDEFGTTSTSRNAATQSNITYDLMVAYTEAARIAAGGSQYAIINEISNAVDSTNKIYGKSESTHPYRDALPRAALVHTVEVNYTETGYLDMDLYWLMGNNEISNLRDQYGADVVVMITATGDGCGLSGDIKATASRAFSVVKLEDCLIERYTLTHEIGHLFGSRHDTDTRSDPYPHGHGISFTSKNFQTVMAVKGNRTIPRIHYLSNPQIRVNGEWIGSWDWEDNARVHDERASAVANFRQPPQPPLSVTITGPTYLDPYEQGTFTANPSGGSGTYVNYRWWIRNDEGMILAPPPEQWIEMTSWEGLQTVQYRAYYDFSLKCIVYDSDGNQAQDIHSVIVGGGGLSKRIVESLPQTYDLDQNHPNPFNATTLIRYNLPEASYVNLVIYDLTGREVMSLNLSHELPGYKQVIWNGRDRNSQLLAAGIYIYSFQAKSSESGKHFRDVRKMVFI